MIRALAAAVAFVGLAVAATAQDAPTADKLAGKWKLTKTDTELPPGLAIVADFQKDGKLKISVTFMEKTQTVDGTWKLADKKLSITTKEGDKEKTETAEVTKLTATELETKDEKGKIDAFTKVKDEKKEEKK